MLNSTEKITIAVGCDHAGYELKCEIVKMLSENGYACIDCGCGGESCHYPFHAEAVCDELLHHRAKFGLLFCGTGVGMMMCASKHAGIRAMLASDPFSVSKSRGHNNANVLCLGGRVLSLETAKELTMLFLTTEFEGGRHRERIEMYDTII